MRECIKQFPCYTGNMEPNARQRITLELSYDVYEQAKIAAIKQRKPMRAVIEDCLRSCLSPAEYPAPASGASVVNEAGETE